MDLSECRDACVRCQQACIQAAVHALVKPEEHPPDRVRLLWDCTDICGTSANLLSRASPFHIETCRACAVICEACAESCSGLNDAIFRQCVEACRACAALCREMAA